MIEQPNISNQAQITQPGLRTTLDQTAQRLAAQINCVQVGIIKAFDAGSQTATIELVLQRQVYNNPGSGILNAPGGNPQPPVPAPPTIVAYPTLFQVPVMVLSGGTGVLTMPIAAGDTCVVLFNDRDLDPWKAQGAAPAPPNSMRVHSIADGIAFVGVRPMTNPQAGYSATKAQLKNNGGEVSVDAKVNIKNAATTLKAVNDLLATVLLAWVDTNGDTPSAATKTAIMAWQAASDSLLET